MFVLDKKGKKKKKETSLARKNNRYKTLLAVEILSFGKQWANRTAIWMQLKHNILVLSFCTIIIIL